MVFVLLDSCSGVLWSIVYIAAIVLGFKRKTYCIPAVSICMNFSWEFWIVMSRISHGVASGRVFIIQACCLMLDVGVFATLLLYGPKTFRKSKICWKAVVGLMVALAVGWILLFHMEMFLKSSFLDNALMSWLFIQRRLKGDRRGDSRLIAVTKLFGTFSPTLLIGILNKNPFVVWMGGICLILDIYYLLLLNNRWERDEENP